MRIEVLGVPLTLLLPGCKGGISAAEGERSGRPYVADSSEIPLAPVCAALGRWPVLNESLTDSPSDDLILRVRYRRRAQHARGNGEDGIVKSGSRLTITRGSVTGWADPVIGRAAVTLPEVDSEDRRDRDAEQAAELIIEALATYLVQGSRLPAILHAAALAEEDRCVLVAGEEGSGKSTLAALWVQSGGSIVADDACFSSVTSRPLRIWGVPWHLHLLPDSIIRVTRQDEISFRMLNGEMKLRIFVPSGQALISATVAGVLFLERSKGASRIEPLSVETAGAAGQIGAQTLVMEGGMGRSPEPSMYVASEIMNGPTARLHFGRDVESAVTLVRNWMRAQP